MKPIQSLLSNAFPLLALTGLLLVGWGLIVTPEDYQTNVQVALWGDRVSSSVDGAVTTALRE